MKIIEIGKTVIVSEEELKEALKIPKEAKLMMYMRGGVYKTIFGDVIDVSEFNGITFLIVEKGDK